jgi:tRNA threonylcarbamoyladenosine biosynthesis protein TsaB
LLHAEQRHAARLLLELDALLAAHGRPLGDVELIALSIGPGTFTGLRIGLATALGLAFGTELRIAPVSTLAAMAWQAREHACVVPLLDARKAQVYAGVYGPDAQLLRADCVCAPAELAAQLTGEGPVHLLGSGAERYRGALEEAFGARAVFLPPERGVPRASSVGVLGQRLASAGGALLPEQVEPAYLRPPDARRSPAAGQPLGERIT